MPLAWITGAGGLIGSYLQRTVPAHWTARALTRQDLDPLSIEELNNRIQVLEGEIARVKAKIEPAVNHRATANALFRKCHWLGNRNSFPQLFEACH